MAEETVTAASAAPIKRGKYDKEDKEFWYHLCVKYHKNKGKYKSKANFLAHEDSGEKVENNAQLRKKMYRNYKDYMDENLTVACVGKGQKEIRRKKYPYHEVEEELVVRLERITSSGEPLPPKSGKRLIARKIADERGKSASFKATYTWLDSALKRQGFGGSKQEEAHHTEQTERVVPVAGGEALERENQQTEGESQGKAPTAGGNANLGQAALPPTANTQPQPIGDDVKATGGELQNLAKLARIDEDKAMMDDNASALSFGSSLYASTNHSASTPVSEQSRRLTDSVPDGGSTKAASATPSQELLRQGATVLLGNPTTASETASLLNDPSIGGSFSASNDSRQTSLLNDPSIGSFSASNASRHQKSPEDARVVQTNAKHDHSRDGSMNTMDPPSKRVRLLSPNAVNTKDTTHKVTEDASFAPDSPVAVLFYGMPVLDDLPCINGGGIDATREVRGITLPNEQPHQSRRCTGGSFPWAKDSQSVAFTNLEIALNQGDMSTVTGLGNVGGASVKKILSDLTNRCLEVDQINWLLDELSDRAINEDRQLRRKSVLDRAARVVSNVMKSHLEDKNVQLKAFNFIGQLCDNLEYAPVANKFFKQTMEVLMLHHHDPNMFYRSLWMIRVLNCRDIGARNLTSKSTGIELIVHAKHQQSLHFDIGLCLLQVLKSHDDSEETTGIEFLMSGMSQHASHDGIQGEGCHLLGRLASHCPKTRRMIVDSNGIDLILQAMAQHDQVEDIQAFGCYALAAFVANRHDYQWAAVDAKGSKAIEQAMRYYPDNAKVQNFGAQLLKCFQELGKSDGISVEKMRCESLKSSLKVHEIICLLDELSDQAIRDDRRLEGPDAAYLAVGVVSNIIFRHLNDTHVACKVLKCLENLCSNFRRQSIRIPCGITADTIRVLQLFHHDSDILYRGLLLLQNWSTDDFLSKTIPDATVQANGVVMILESMRQHSNHAGIQQIGCDILGWLAWINPEYKGTITNSNGIGLILHAMQGHEQNENVQREGCEALYWLADDHKANQRAMIEANGVKIIQQAMRQFPKNSVVELYGGKLLNHDD